MGTQAVIQKRMPFLGKPRMPGDVISPDELKAVPFHVIRANKETGNIILTSEEGDEPESPGLLAHALERQADKIKALEAEVATLKGAAPAGETDVAQRLTALEAAATTPSPLLIAAIQDHITKSVAAAIAGHKTQAPRKPGRPPRERI